RRAGVAGSALTVLLAHQIKGVSRTLMDPHAVVFQQLLKLTNRFAMAIARLQVDFLQGEIVHACAAKLEAAGAQQQNHAGHHYSAFDHPVIPLPALAPRATANQLATMLTSLPGTTITLRIVRPSVKRRTFSLARAAASTSSRLALAGTSIWPRSLPLTCTTRVRESCTRALSSTVGQGASIRSLPLPRCFHSSWQMCGVIGASSSTTVSRPSCSRARSCSVAVGAFSSTFISVITWAMAVLNLWNWPISMLACLMAWWMA